MAYNVPQVDVFQEFRLVPADITDVLRAHIGGPNALLHRHSEADEKSTINVGDYDPNADTTYDWPGQAVGSTVDLDYVKVFIDGAKLMYFEDLTGSGSTIAPVAGRANRIRSSSVSFKANGTDYPVSASLYDRGARVGDLAWVRGTDGSDAYELWTYIRDFVGETVAAIIGSATADDANDATQGASVNIDKVAGADNCVQLSVDATSYDGREDGDITEYYTIEVVQGSTDGVYSTARLRVTSASGNDDDTSVTPADADSYFSVGGRNLRLSFLLAAGSSCSAAADGESVSQDDLIIGQKWRVRVAQAFTAPIASSGGTYTGEWDTTYIVEVTKGGAFGTAEVTVTTTTGVDASGPTLTTASGAAIAIGTEGVTLTLTGSSGLSRGDKYNVTVTAATEGAMRTLVLGHNLPDEIQSAADLDLRLYIKKDIEVTENRLGDAPLVNWEADANGLTVKEGATAFDSSWTDGGTELALPIKGGTVYLQYREWVTDLCGLVESAANTDEMNERIPGPEHPDNPLKWGVKSALANSNGVPVKFSAVCQPDDLDSWQAMLDKLVGRDDVYSLVPLTFNLDVLNLYVAHVNNQSGPEVGRWRGAFFCLQAKETGALVDATTSSDTDTVLAKLGDNPAVSGTQYTLLTITSGNANLVELGIRAGDVVRYLYTTDGFGGTTYTEFVVDEVVNEQSVVLSTGHASAVTTPQKVEIWRNYRKAEIAEDLADRYGAFGNRRICTVWPDEFVDGTYTVPGYFLCCMLAGLRSGVVPHQGLTNVEISGPTSVRRSTEFFNGGHLDTLASGGGWVVTKKEGGPVYSRHALTTDRTDLNRQEEMIRVNVDSMSYVFLRLLEPYIGRANAVPDLLSLLYTEVRSVIEFLRSAGRTPLLGGQLIDADIRELRLHDTERDRVVIVLDLQVPAPLNYVELHLVI